MADICNWDPRGEDSILLGLRNRPRVLSSTNTHGDKVLNARDNLKPEGPFGPLKMLSQAVLSLHYNYPRMHLGD